MKSVAGAILFLAAAVVMGGLGFVTLAAGLVCDRRT